VTVEDRVAGFTTFGPARDLESGPDGELYALNVNPDHWRAGVGSALLSAAHDGLADLGHHEATLWVVTGNIRARSFYERHGWRPDVHERTVDVGGEVIPEARYARRVP
jgi:GNAT superfamily N-acetyltransferase